MRSAWLVLSRVGFYVFSALMAAFFALPMLWLLTAPFNPRATLAVEPSWPPSLVNFQQVFGNTFAMRAFGNSVIQASGAMVGVTLIAMLASYALSRTHLPWKEGALYGLILFSSVVTGTAAMVPIFLLIFRLGLIDTHLGVIFVFMGGFLPSAIFILRDFMNSIPRSYEESALVNGASSLRMFWDIVLPITRPGMMVVAIYTFVNAWGTFLIPFILLRSPDKMPAATAIYSFYTEGGTPILTLTSTYALLYTLPVLLLYLFVNWRYGFRFFGGIKQ
ncbi:MAG: carbohydrate ABC transporter permease [Deinococcus sp.]|nr:carbohydrate ABC transporter permease [Deinococcus sp.]